MFGKLTLTLDKSSLVASIAVAVAICASFLLKIGIERLIGGNSATVTNKHPRKTGLMLTITSLLLLAVSILTILESDALVQFLLKEIKQYKKSITNTKSATQYDANNA